MAHKACLFADVLSVLAMTMGAVGARECLKYKLAGTAGDVGAWGSEFVRHLAGEVGAEYGARRAAAPGAAVGDLLALLSVILPHNMSHNAEVEAVDLCLETEQLDALAAPGAVDEASHARVCRYLLKSADYLGDAAAAAHAQEVAFALYTAHRQFAQALVAAHAHCF